ncbi:hypothetical protein [Bdellovibrio bacteriovorus]|uniref:hypothetical protein n=1 Tax=Bdellovibrio bacteriovorus TaxID=959 RepID=UPI0035A877EF
MKSFILSLTSLLALVSTPAHAFISSQEEGLLVEAMNQINPSLHVENIRCSMRSRMCLVRMEVGQQQRRAGCMIERIGDATDLYSQNEDKATGKTTVSLSPYAQEALDRCVSQIL